MSSPGAGRDGSSRGCGRGGRASNQNLAAAMDAGELADLVTMRDSPERRAQVWAAGGPADYFWQPFHRLPRG
jgi:hypothetical protein